MGCSGPADGAGAQRRDSDALMLLSHRFHQPIPAMPADPASGPPQLRQTLVDTSWNEARVRVSVETVTPCPRRLESTMVGEVPFSGLVPHTARPTDQRVDGR